MTLRAHAVCVLMPLLLAGLATPAGAHCDTLNGPVVAAARAALQSNDVTPVLKWVRESEEAEVRAAFQNVIAVRTLSPVARELADRFFFETVVRLHRLGEGEPYTGLRPSAEVPDDVVAADEALRNGDVDSLVRRVMSHVAAGLRERFARVRALEPHADESVAAGRRYVAAYVEFVHLVEQVAGEAGEPHAH